MEFRGEFSHKSEHIKLFSVFSIGFGRILKIKKMSINDDNKSSRQTSLIERHSIPRERTRRWRNRSRTILIGKAGPSRPARQREARKNSLLQRIDISLAETVDRASLADQTTGRGV